MGFSILPMWIVLLLFIVKKLCVVEGLKNTRYVDILNLHEEVEAEDLGRVTPSSKQFHYDGIDSNIEVEESYIQQRLDHFASSKALDSSTPEYYEQRYFRSSRYIHPMKSDRDDNNSGEHQKYNENESGWDQQDYAFLCVGGEGPPLDKSVLIDSPHCTGDMIELARILHKQFGINVHLFALEHRYYGKSFPDFSSSSTPSPVSNQNLKYLSSTQAIADIAHFISSMNEKIIRTSTIANSIDNENNSNLKWITFGGSYPGMLSAFVRLKYPYLVYGAISSSAPIEAQVDFPQYNEQVGQDLLDPRVGGSHECHHIIQEGHEQLVQLLSAKGGNKNGTRNIRFEDNNNESIDIANEFNLCDANTTLQDKNNIKLFLGDGVIFVPAQSNDPNCEEELCNIKQLCSAIIDMKKTAKDQHQDTPSWKILSQISKRQHQQQQKHEGRRRLKQNQKDLIPIQNKQYYNSNDIKNENYDSCVDVDWNATLKYIQAPIIDNKINTVRSWLWQTCTEFGYYQTCPLGRSNKHIYYGCPYGQGYHTIDQDLQMCSIAFNISTPNVYKNIQQTIENYGGWNIGGRKGGGVSVSAKTTRIPLKGDKYNTKVNMRKKDDKRNRSHIETIQESLSKDSKAGHRILSIIGSVDPWSKLALNHSTPDLPVIDVVSASHHYWTHPVKKNDDWKIKIARKKIHRTVIEWLQISSTPADYDDWNVTFKM